MGLITSETNGLFNKDSLEEARKGKIVYLDIDEIIPNPDNIGTLSDDEIDAKVESIEEVGLLQPLLVQKTKDGYLLNTGHKRLQAIKRIRNQGRTFQYLGRELRDTVPCQYLKEDSDPEHFELMAICSNAHHLDNPSERREKVLRMHRHYQKMIQENRKPAGREREWITAMTGISDGSVKKILADIHAKEVAEETGEEDTFGTEDKKSKELNKEVTKRLNSLNRYLLNVDLRELTDLDRQKLNEVLRDVQNTMEELIFVYPS